MPRPLKLFLVALLLTVPAMYIADRLFPEDPGGGKKWPSYKMRCATCSHEFKLSADQLAGQFRDVVNPDPSWHGKAHCPKCKEQWSSKIVDQISDESVMKPELVRP